MTILSLSSLKFIFETVWFKPMIEIMDCSSIRTTKDDKRLTFLHLNSLYNMTFPPLLLSMAQIAAIISFNFCSLYFLLAGMLSGKFTEIYGMTRLINTTFHCCSRVRLGSVGWLKMFLESWPSQTSIFSDRIISSFEFQIVTSTKYWGFQSGPTV